MRSSVAVHLLTLPRWFAVPFFGAPAVMGALLAGGMRPSSWLGVLATLLIMAGGHSFNSYLDYAWTGLDKGSPEDRSAEKTYTGGQSVLVAGRVTERGVVLNALAWYALALVPVIYLAVNVSPFVLVIAVMGMLITFWYARAKFNWTHETALGVAVGPLPVLMGMYATSGSPPWAAGLLVSVIFSILPAFAGLALDEWPDAEANLKKGVKSIAYAVWESGVSLEWYLSSWILFMFLYQVFLISTGFLSPWTAIAFVTWPGFVASMVLLKRHFRGATTAMVAFALLYPVLVVVGQAG